MNDTERTCIRCGQTKLSEAFGVHATSRGGRRAQCKQCLAEKAREARKDPGHWSKTPEARKSAVRRSARYQRANPVVASAWARDYRLRTQYGVTVVQYLEKLAEQGFCCVICGSLGRANDPMPLDVDHCHDTNMVRDLICSGCNAGMGQMGDDPNRLIAAAMYLMRHQSTLDRLMRGGVVNDPHGV